MHRPSDAARVQRGLLGLRVTDAVPRRRGEGLPETDHED
jgi:hypothetical protein